SRGPKTRQGKAISSRNAVTHGLTARHALLSGEDTEKYRSLRAGLSAEFRPSTKLEHELVERSASLIWRLRRIPIFEAALLASIEESDLSDLFDFKASEKARLGETVKEFLNEGFSIKLGRYETSLQRQLLSLLKELRDLQDRRLARNGSQEGEAEPNCV